MPTLPYGSTNLEFSMKQLCRLLVNNAHIYTAHVFLSTNILLLELVPLRQLRGLSGSSSQVELATNVLDTSILLKQAEKFGKFHHYRKDKG
jgi:hypothetical protein